MSKTIFMTCRVCGAQYRACRNLHKGELFNWREIACSPECGAKYFDKVMKSREISTPEKSDQVVSDSAEVNAKAEQSPAKRTKRSTNKTSTEK